MLASKNDPSRHPAFLVALEACLIVFGVVLAYLSTAWYEARQERRAAAEALASIVEEIHENRAAVLGSLRYHSEIQGVLRTALEAGVPPARSSFPQGYVRPAEILTTAWDLASARGAMARIPHGDVLEIARLYSDQDRYTDTARDVGSLIYGAIFDAGGESILDRYPNLLEIVMTFTFRECQLLAHQDELLASLDGGGEGGSDPAELCRGMPAG